MRAKFVEIFKIAVLSFLAWIVVLGFLSYIRGLSRAWFVILHYFANVIVFGFVFFVYFKYLGSLPAFKTMVASILSLLTFEFVFWVFIYNGELWFLNIIDWVIPALLIAFTIYEVGRCVNEKYET